MNSENHNHFVDFTVFDCDSCNENAITSGMGEAIDYGWGGRVFIC
jgi:hypothetical protein